MLIPMVLMILCFCKIDVSAHDSYYLAIIVDESTNRYHGEIIHEMSENHREVDQGGYGKAVEDHAMTAEIPDIDADDWPIDKEGENEMLYYTFPSIHAQNGWKFWKETLDASDNDLAMAQRVVDYPLAGLNDAISFILSETGWTSSTGTKTDFLEIGRNLGNYSDFTVNVGDNHYDVTIKKSPGGKDAKTLNIGIKADDYISVTVNGETRTFVYRCKKGYYGDDENDPLYYLTTDKYSDIKKKFEKNGDVQYIDWKMLVMQGNYNYSQNRTFDNMENTTQPSQFEQLLTSALGGILTSIRSMLGLYSINDLMTNTGTRDRNYSMGLYPSSWSSAVILLHVICQMIAWGCIGFSILKLIYKRQLATMNVVEKVSWQESLKNLILCGFLLAAFTLVFNLFVRFNYRLVDLFASSTTLANFDQFFTLTSSGGAVGSFGKIAVSAANLILTIYFNFFYFLRGITIAVLYGLAPLAIYALSLGGKMSGVFSNFLKELFGNIFIQTIHAILIAFFCNISASTTPRVFEMLIILYSFIPISKFVKEKLFGMSGGLDGAASGLMKTAGSVAGGVAGGLLGAKVGAKGGGNHAPSGSSSDGGSMAQSMDNKLSQSKSASDVNLKDQPKHQPSKLSQKIQDFTPVSVAKEMKDDVSDIFGKPIANAVTTGKNIANNSLVAQNAKTIGKAVVKTAGNLAGGAAAIGGGAMLSAIDPHMGAKLAGAGAGRLGNIKNDLGSVPRELQSNNDFATSLQYNGASRMNVGKDLTSYDVAGEFNPETGHLDNNNMDQAQKKEFEDMYTAQKLHNEGVFDKKDLSAEESKSKKVYERMQKNQVRMDISSDGKSAKIVRRSVDINNLKNSMDKTNPLAGTSRMSDRSDNRNLYYHDPNSRR